MSTFPALFDAILDVGRDPHSGGYRRFAWSAADRTLRDWFSGCAAARGMDVEEDRNGNLWAWWLPPGWNGDPRGAFVTGSHLDSVPDGGAFDGPLGVVSAFAAVDLLRERGVVPRVPVGVTAFSDEEGARFGVACVGSRLSAGVLAPDRALALRDASGVTLAEALRTAGRDPAAVGADPTLRDRVGLFVELHVEQGRALGPLDRPLAVASGIWPHGRWRYAFSGRADHAGTTRMQDRRDPMPAYAATVLAARSRARACGAVATFGKVAVAPNGTNAVPSRVDAWLDARADTEQALSDLVDAVAADARAAAGAEEVGLEVTAESVSPAVVFPAPLADRIRAAVGGDVPVLPTAAGHDAGILAAVVPTAMLFVRNPTGVSHSPDEHAEPGDCVLGVEALAAVMTEWTTR